MSLGSGDESAGVLADEEAAADASVEHFASQDVVAAQPSVDERLRLCEKPGEKAGGGIDAKDSEVGPKQLLCKQVAFSAERIVGEEEDVGVELWVDAKVLAGASRADPRDSDVSVRCDLPVAVWRGQVSSDAEAEAVPALGAELVYDDVLGEYGFVLGGHEDEVRRQPAPH